MPDLAGPWDGSTFAQSPYFRDRGPLEVSGVLGPPQTTPGGGDLGLTAAGFVLTLALGRAHVRGAAYERTGSAWTDTPPANSSGLGPRNDLIVLRRDLTAKTVVPLRIQGTAAASPVDPAITQVENGVWDLLLHRVQLPPSSGTPVVITDLRRWLAPDGGVLTPAYQYPGVGGAPPFQNTWKAFDATGYERPRYWLDAQGVLRIVGVFALTAGLTTGQTTVMFNVPAGYRPPRQVMRWAAQNNVTPQRIDVLASGDVVHTSSNGALAANTGYVALDLSVPLYE